jgi:hypothetical protein
LVAVGLLDQHLQQEVYKVRTQVFTQLLQVKTLGDKAAVAAVEVLQQILLAHESVVPVVRVVEVLNVMVAVVQELPVKEMVEHQDVTDLH